MFSRFHRAAQEGQLEIVNLLLEHHADVNVQNRQGMYTCRTTTLKLQMSVSYP